jgi:hypothetical protein
MITGEYSKSFKPIREEKINLLFNPKKPIEE